MAIPFNTLLEESKCYLCLGISQAEALELALLNRIASGSSGSGELEFVAFLSQTGVAAPTVNIIKNTLGEIPTTVYIGPGSYELNCSAFTGANTVVQTGLADWSNLTSTQYSSGVGQIQITCIDLSSFPALALADGVLQNTPIHIVVYP